LSRRRAALSAWTISGVTVLLLGAVVTLGALTPQDRLPDDLRPRPAWFVAPAYLLGLAAIGALIAARHPQNLIGWLMCAAAGTGGVIELCRSYSEYSLVNGHPGLFAVEWVAWLGSWLWLPWLTLQVVYLPLLFPDGRVPSKRWAWLIWAATATALVSVISQALHPALLKGVNLRNPTGVSDPSGYLSLLAVVATATLIALGLASMASVFVRLKSSPGDGRQQLKWFATAITVLVTLVAAQTIDEVFLEVSSPWLEGLISLSYLMIPVSIGFSVLRYRLYDIDVVINRTLVYGALATFISAVYLVAVVGAGALVGRDGQVHLLVSLLAAGAVALAFQPARERLQRLANRLVYGRRATPYDALAVLSRRIAETAPSELLLNDMARAVCDALGLPSASLWLRAGEELRAVAVWPDSGQQSVGLPPPADNGTFTFPVQHEGRLLGAISVTVPPGRSLAPSDQRLLTDVANQAGLVFRNLGLTADLMARVAELRESRRRLVTAQEEERRRLERDLHDGAQQHLFGLKITIRDLRALLLRPDPLAAGAALERLEQQADEALRTVRELARGVSPPLLTAQGLPGALSARARSAPIDVRVSTDGAGRYSADLEGAVYFCCSEALQNAIRHAQASTVRIRLAQEGDELVFAVEDDGRGFDVQSTRSGAGLQSMRDRVDVVGGTLDVLSRPDGGTTILGRVCTLPLRNVASAASARTDGPAEVGEPVSGPAPAGGTARPQPAWQPTIRALPGTSKP
jgi:signal transduction histidine kinase